MLSSKSRRRKMLFWRSKLSTFSWSWLICLRPSNSRPVVSKNRRYAKSKAWPMVNVISSAWKNSSLIGQHNFFKFKIRNSYQFVTNEDVTSVLLRIRFFSDETEKLFFRFIIRAIGDAMQWILVKDPLYSGKFNGTNQTKRRRKKPVYHTFPLGSWMATPSTETVSSTLGVLWPSALRNCCENRSLRMPSLTTSMPLGWSTSVLPKNCLKKYELIIITR